MHTWSTAKKTVLLCLVTVSAAASVEVPLTWKSVQIQTDDHGGAELNARIDSAGELERLQLTIRDHRIDIPLHCLRGLTRPWLNGIRMTYGQFESGQSYWSVEIPFDGSGSVTLGSNFNLVFSETDLLWSYQAIQLGEGTWEDRDVCPFSSRGYSE